MNKAQAGHFAKAGVEAGRGVWEFRLAEGEGEELALGGEIGVDVFEAGQKIDATGTSIGKGYGGVVKKYNFAMQDATHGNSISHRAPGSDSPPAAPSGERGPSGPPTSRGDGRPLRPRLDFSPRARLGAVVS